MSDVLGYTCGRDVASIHLRVLILVLVPLCPSSLVCLFPLPGKPWQLNVPYT